MKWKQLSQLSAYARAESHLTQQTLHGAIVTVSFSFLAIILFFSELQQYLTSRTTQEMNVDLTRGELLDVRIDITFPALPCAALSLDLRDISGRGEYDVGALARTGELHKYRLDQTGKRIGLGEYLAPKDDLVNFFWLQPNPKKIEDIEREFKNHEGCNIVGWLHVQRVAGNFHISLHAENFMLMSETQQEIAKAIFSMHSGKGFPFDMRNIEIHHDLSKVNVSHIIHKFAFGPQFPGQVNPLDGFHRIVHHGSGIYKYFLKVVPTKYYRGWGWSRLDTNQYSVTEYFQKVDDANMAMPGIFFMYDLSPITVTIRQNGRSFAHFVVRLCAVVGGVFAVAGMTDRWLHRVVTAVQQLRGLL